MGNGMTSLGSAVEGGRMIPQDFGQRMSSWFGGSGLLSGYKRFDPKTGLEVERNFGSAMKNPLTKLGLGLLEQGGPQVKPHSIGQDFSRAAGGVQQGDDDEEERAYQKQLREAQMAKLKAQQKFLDDPAGALESMGGLFGATPRAQIGAPPASAPPAGAIPRYPPGYQGR